jgi:hypothetical protein
VEEKYPGQRKLQRAARQVATANMLDDRGAARDVVLSLDPIEQATLSLYMSDLTVFVFNFFLAYLDEAQRQETWTKLMLQLAIRDEGTSA